MAIDTTNEKLAMLNFGMPFQPNLPLSPSTLGQDDQQQLLWGYPGILWSAVVQVFNWITPTDAPAGTVAEIVILADDWASVIEAGQATSAAGSGTYTGETVWEFQAASTPTNGEKRLAFWHQWDSDKETASIFGGAAIAEAVLQ